MSVSVSVWAECAFLGDFVLPAQASLMYFFHLFFFLNRVKLLLENSYPWSTFLPMSVLLAIEQSKLISMMRVANSRVLGRPGSQRSSPACTTPATDTLFKHEAEERRSNMTAK